MSGSTSGDIARTELAKKNKQRNRFITYLLSFLFFPSFSSPSLFPRKKKQRKKKKKMKKREKKKKKKEKRKKEH